MNLRQLEIYKAVLRTESVSEAARLLGISQPACSKMLREAEAQLGLRLFDRRSGRLVPRAELQPLADAVEQVLLDVERVRVLADELRDSAAPSVAIGAIPTATMTVVPRAVAVFRRAFPRTRVNIFALPTSQTIQDVATGTLDVGLVYGAKRHPAIETIDLMETEVVCAMLPTHPLAARARVRPRDLERHAFVSFRLDEPISLAINDAFRASGARCNPAVLVSHSFAACGLAEQGVGVALITPFLITSGLFSGLITRPLEPRIALRPKLLRRRQRAPSPELDCLVDALRRVAEAQIAGKASAAG
jgi:DNA-binding transcriptional LysR family regulator